METFLLNALFDSNEYDKHVIGKSKDFVDEIATKVDVYFFNKNSGRAI